MENEKNRQLTTLIQELKKASSQQNVKIWRRVADDLEKPTRSMRTVNVYKIEKYAKDNDIVIVPGKVLGTGELSKNVQVAAYHFSYSAFKKINETGKAISIMELVQKNPKGQGVKILG
ncbi:MAG: 50S ribosomal protein L18e [Nanoarchaeota archaeon]